AMAGIAPKRLDESGYQVIRPLLNVSRKEIEAYIEEKGLEPRRDLTNDEALYTRNKIRLELIPLLEKEFNPNVTETLARLAELAGEDKEFLHHMARAAYEGAATGEGRLDIRKLNDMMPALRTRVYMAALKDKGLTEDVTAKHLKAIDALREAMNHGNPYTELPGGYRVMRVKRELVFFAPGEQRNPVEKIDFLC
ncbi:MAG: TilS substrate-binding domain-containing protein, partial [Firmicutes bacterium]|nr:TilS substrate-binding domain-containing protein [Bacillota bacterium]